MVQHQPDHQLGRLPARPARKRAPRWRVLRSAAWWPGEQIELLRSGACDEPCVDLAWVSPRSWSWETHPARVAGALPNAPRHKRCQGGQRGDIHTGARFDTHPRAGHAVEHPKRYFLLAARLGTVEGASRAKRPRLIYYVTDPNHGAAPRMPRIKHLPGAGPVGVLVFSRTIRSDRIRRWATVRRLWRSCRGRPRRRLRALGRPPQPWPHRSNSTNIGTEPLSGGRSVSAEVLPPTGASPACQRRPESNQLRTSRLLRKAVQAPPEVIGQRGALARPAGQST